MSTKGKKGTKRERNYYNAINMDSLNYMLHEIAKNLIKGASKANKVDEHGSWDFGIETDHKGRGSALNWDLYGIAKDYHSKRWLIVIQIREWSKRSRNGFARIRKNYFLIGRNEDNSIFAHSISGRKIHAAIKKGNCPVYAAQTWIFGAEYSKVIRQGDIAFIPTKKKISGFEGKILLEDSHELKFQQGIREDENLYVKNFSCKHLQEIHPDVNGKGTYKVVIGKRAEFWNFAAPTAD